MFQIDLMAPPPKTRSSPGTESPDVPMTGAVYPNIVLSMDSTAPAMGSSKVKENVDTEEEMRKEPIKEGDSPKIIDDKGRVTDLQLDLENAEREVNSARNKLLQINPKQTQQQMQFKTATREEPVTEKPGPATGTSPLSIAGWPSGVPPMSYMTPLQGVVPMEASSITQAHLQSFQSQPRPKRCATHCHIARNILFLQHFMKMNSFWTGSPAPGSLFGPKSCSLNSLPTADIQGNLSLRASSAYNSPVMGGLSSSPADSRKQQIMIQQAMPTVPPGSLLGPAFIFPLNQQPPVAVVGARPGTTAKPSGPSSIQSSVAAPTMSFSYPNISAAANESQYMALLPNNPYPFPVPAPPQAMPMFNGSSFYSQHPAAHVAQLFQAQPSALTSNGSSSQKFISTQSGAAGTGNMNLHNFGSHKHQYVPPQLPSLHEGDVGEDRVARGAMNMYCQNLGMQPIPPQNFTLKVPSTGASQMVKKAGIKASAESLPPSFAMSFGGNPNGTSTCQAIDMASLAQNHAIFQSETARHNIQMMAASGIAAQVTQKNSFRVIEDAKSSGVDSSDDKKTAAGKTHGISNAFGRSDLHDSPVQLNDAIESSSRSLVSSNINRSSSSHPLTSNSMAISNATIQSQIQQQQQQQQEHQRMCSTPVNRSKTPVTNNGSMYLEHQSSSPTKFQVAGAGFPQNQSSQWKRTSQAQSTLSSSSTATVKSLSQQHARSSQAPVHAQISFGGSPKTLSTSQGQAVPSSNQCPSPMMVGSPTTSSEPKGMHQAQILEMVTKNSNGRSLHQPKGANGSPKMVTKNSPANTSQKAASVLGAKNQMQQLPKGMHQAQIFFSNPYTQHSTSSSTSSPGGYYMSKRRPDHQHTPSSTASGAMSGGVISMNPPVGTGTNDPVKAIAAATANNKGGGVPSQGSLIHNASQFVAQSPGTVLPPGFSYHLPVTPAVQVKQTEQNQPAA